jgi:hypothetical protein
MTIDAPGWYDLDLADYLAHDSLSSTFARLLTKHVPAKAVERKDRKPTRAMNLGSTAHSYVLGAGPELIVWEHDGRTKDGKAERAAAAPFLETRAAVAVTEDEYDQIVGMAGALRAHPETCDILDSSEAEVSGFWRDGSVWLPSRYDGLSDTTAAYEVWLRARYDLLSDTAAYDYKTTSDVTRRGFSRAMAAYGYHQQADFYERGLVALEHPAAGTPMRFICQETEPPYLVQIHTPDEEAREVARLLNDRAIRIYAACTASGVWPGYDALAGEPISLPAWYFFDNEEVLPDDWRPLDDEITVSA